MRHAVAVTIIKNPLQYNQDIQTRINIVEGGDLIQAEKAASKETLEDNEGFQLHHVTSLPI